MAQRGVLNLFPGIGDKKAKKIIDQIVQEKKGIEYLSQIGLKDLYHLLFSLDIGRKSPGDKISQIAEFYRPLFDAEYKKGKKQRWIEIETLKRIAFDHISCSDFVNSIMMNNIENEDGNEGKSGESIILSTIHSAKGLEWDVVFIICANDGCIPYYPERKSQDEMDEDVRLLHVGITRAKEHLYLTAPKNQSHQEATGKISRFLTDEIVADCLDVEEF